MKNYRLIILVVLIGLIIVGIMYAMKVPCTNAESLKKQLKAMVQEDQALREKIDYVHYDTALWDQIQAVDKKNTASLKDMLKSLPKQWITISEFGEDADNNAWLLVQHADFDRAFQKEVLERLEKLCLEKETNCINTAYLADRLAVAEKRPQRYGTQFHMQGGMLIPYEIEDPANIDVRRKSIGLSTLKEYEDKLKEVTKLSN